MAIIIASTHFAYPRRDGQAELAWVEHRTLPKSGASIRLTFNTSIHVQLFGKWRLEVGTEVARLAIPWIVRC